MTTYLILPMESLQRLCGFVWDSPYSRPDAGDCLGKRLPDGRMVVSICFEFEPGKVRATLR